MLESWIKLQWFAFAGERRYIQMPNFAHKCASVAYVFLVGRMEVNVAIAD